ncbi:MAG TPA: 2-amino-4-hydroxy-6-hydroxymethyldihydropteridine diphosphokinase [Candidatus Saccharimonadia bacterium]|nr:2-amino-4-hydroxy-6-hydroxymethyldihydropteridine diphosphokinase [Candidatus Saccharimonadia bacterium]
MSVRRGVFVGLGANLDDPRAQIRAALDAIEALSGTHVLAVSRLYRSPAWGPIEQPDYVNAVAELETVLGPEALLEALLAIERRLGRDRSVSRYGPRRIDLDLLVDGGTSIESPGLRVPHPHLAQRAFVLVPLAEIAPDVEVPGIGHVRDLLARLDPADRAQVRALEAGTVRGE